MNIKKLEFEFDRMDDPERELANCTVMVLARESEKNSEFRLNGMPIKVLDAKVGAFLSNPLFNVASLNDLGVTTEHQITNGPNFTQYVLLTELGREYAIKKGYISGAHGGTKNKAGRAGFRALGS